MVQSFDYSVNRPNYNAVKINIKKPEVNAGDKKTSYADDNGIYNAVNIEIDNPTVNTEPKKVYDYPYAEELITRDMMNFNPCPVKFPVTYHTTNVILPKMENELEMGLEFPEPEEAEEVEEVVAVLAHDHMDGEALFQRQAAGMDVGFVAGLVDDGLDPAAGLIADSGFSVEHKGDGGSGHIGHFCNVVDGKFGHKAPPLLHVLKLL